MFARERFANICLKISLALAAALPFLTPFNSARNIDMQGLLLIVSGGFGWTALLLGHRETLKSLGRLESALLAVFAFSCVISLFVNPHFGYDMLGAPYIRLGTAGLLACVGIGLLATTIKTRRLLVGLYTLIASLAAVSIPYSWLRLHSLVRIGGVFSQADIFACFLGIGLLLGWQFLALYLKRQKTILAVQTLLAALLVLTETRVVLLLVITLSLWWFWGRPGHTLKKLSVTVGVMIFILSASSFLPSRVTSANYASISIHYRLSLQRDALIASGRRAVVGYGPGNLADALECPRLDNQQLQTTCHQGYFFNSSHNIFLDRILAIGWLGGLCYLGLIGLAIYRSCRAVQELRILTFTLILIAGYYLTNVTSVTLELLFWVLVMQGLSSHASASR